MEKKKKKKKQELNAPLFSLPLFRFSKKERKSPENRKVSLQSLKLLLSFTFLDRNVITFFNSVFLLLFSLLENKKKIRKEMLAHIPRCCTQEKAQGFSFWS